MRKLRKWKCYALLRTIRAAIITTKRSPHCYAHCDDEKGIVLYSDRSSRRCAPHEDVLIGRKEIQITAYPASHIYNREVFLQDAIKQIQTVRIGTDSMISNTSRTKIGLVLTLALFFICVLFSEAQAQSAGERAVADGLAPIKALRVGDYVPKDFWDREVLVYTHGDTSRIKLETFRGKPFILDFWATWCGYCIAGFPDLLDIKRSKGKDLNVLLVNTKDTKDTYEKIHSMPEDILRVNSLPSVILDEYLGQLFPHGPIPHYVWINPKGRVAGITFKEFVNSYQVEYFIKTNKRYESSN